LAVDGGEQKREKIKRFFGTDPKKTQPGQDGSNVSGRYGRLCGPILPVLVINSDQLWQQSFHVWHFLTKIDPKTLPDNRRLLPTSNETYDLNLSVTTLSISSF